MAGFPSTFSDSFFAYGVYLPFWSLWFKEQGVSSTDIGLLVGLGLATRCVANIVITPRVHRVEHLMPTLRLVEFLLPSFFVWFPLFFTGGSFLAYGIGNGVV